MWKGGWGEVSPNSQPVVRFYKKKKGTDSKIISYPYKLFAHWTWQSGEFEQVIIEVFQDRIIVTGKDLLRLMEALHQDQLKFLREQDKPIADEVMFVRSIQVERPAR